MSNTEDPTFTAIKKLTRSWEHTFGPADLGHDRPKGHEYETVKYLPLLEQLRAAINPSLGATQDGGGLAHTRNMLNLAAFEMWERIDGIIRAWGREFGVPAAQELTVVLAKVHVQVLGLPSTDPRVGRFRSMVRGWVVEIEALFDPPVVVNEKFRGKACPLCGVTAVTDRDGGVLTALFAFYRKGAWPIARCRACGGVWEGERALLELGFSLKAVPDVEVLREMGVGA